MTDVKPNVPKLRFPGFTDPWEQRRLGEMFAFLRNNTLSRAELSDSQGSAFDVHYGDVLVKFGSVLDLREQALPRIADDEVVARLTCDRLRDGDVVVADTAEDDTAGKCAELRGVGESTVFSGLHTMPLRPLSEYAPGFLGYCLNAPAFRKQLVPLMQGIKVISVSRTAMAEALATIPSLPEQRQIGALFRDLDSLITLHQREGKKELKTHKIESPLHDDRKYIYFSYHSTEEAMLSAAEKIKGIVAAAEPGSIFIPADFQDVSSSENVHNALSRLERSGKLRRCARGVYCKPRYSELLQEEVPPSIDAIAHAIAQSNGWTIIPSGNHALNLLGLDTQVPASFTYVSSGPYKEYDIDGTKLRFKHRANRDIIEKSYSTCLFIQALKELGKNGVDKVVVDKLGSKLSDSEAITLYEETRNATSWVFEVAKAIKEAKGL